MTIKHVTTEEELQQVVKENKKPIAVDFYADWCPPCRAFAPIFEQVSQTNKNYVFVKVNVDKAQALAKRYNISSIPTLVILNFDGSFRERRIGSMSKQSFVNMLH